MVKIATAPLDIRGLKIYKEKSPSKYEDKFGDLDLDNIPKEYMKKRLVQVGENEWKEEEYFDAIQYRKDRTKTKPQTPLIPELAGNAPKVDFQPAPVRDLEPILESNIGKPRV